MMDDCIDCAQAKAHLEDFLKRELTPELQRDVRDHLARCRHCRCLSKYEENFLALLDEAAARTTCPDRVRARIVSLLRAQSPAQGAAEES